MENIYYFALGVLSVLAIAGVYSMFRLNAQVKRLSEQTRFIEEEFKTFHRIIETIQYDYESRITKEIGYVNDDVREITRDINDRLRELDGRLDSRHDKLANNIADHIADIYQTIQRLEETIEKNADTLC